MTKITLIPFVGGPTDGARWCDESRPEYIWSSMPKRRGKTRMYALYRLDGQCYRFVRCATPDTDADLRSEIEQEHKEYLEARHGKA